MMLDEINTISYMCLLVFDEGEEVVIRHHSEHLFSGVGSSGSVSTFHLQLFHGEKTWVTGFCKQSSAGSLETL